MIVAAAAPPTPFKGLAPFQDTELDAQLFCGRDREREVIVANLLASRLTVLYGASGVGKTSLLRAGVTPALRQISDAGVVFYSSWAGDPGRGRNAQISPRATLTRSIIWDDVVIEESCSVDECIVTDGVRVVPGSSYRRSVLRATASGVEATPFKP